MDKLQRIIYTNTSLTDHSTIVTSVTMLFSDYKKLVDKTQVG